MSLSMFQSSFHAKCVYVNVPNTNEALIIHNYFSFFFSYIAQHSIFLTLPESKKETISLPPTSLFLFLLIQEGACSELLGLLCYIHHCYLVQLMCESRLFSL